MRTEFEGILSDAINKAVILVESNVTDKTTEQYLEYEEALSRIHDFEMKEFEAQRNRNR
jgi:hypothetical protein